MEVNEKSILAIFVLHLQSRIDAEFERLKKLGVEIVDPPTIRPWGAKNMSFLDPDNNLVTFRCFLKQEDYEHLPHQGDRKPFPYPTSPTPHTTPPKTPFSRKKKLLAFFTGRG